MKQANQLNNQIWFYQEQSDQIISQRDDESDQIYLWY